MVPIHFDVEGRWRAVSAEVIGGIKEWRLQHPTATLAEIEAAVDERLARFRARLLQDVALASQAADLSQSVAQGAAGLSYLWWVGRASRAPRAPPHAPPGPPPDPGAQLCRVSDLLGRLFPPG